MSTLREPVPPTFGPMKAYGQYADPQCCLEIRCALVRKPTGLQVSPPMVLTCWAQANGTFGHTLIDTPLNLSNSLSNLQPTLPFPGKVVPGWQAEVVEFVRTSLYTILEIR